MIFLEITDFLQNEADAGSSGMDDLKSAMEYAMESNSQSQSSDESERPIETGKDFLSDDEETEDERTKKVLGIPVIGPCMYIFRPCLSNKKTEVFLCLRIFFQPHCHGNSKLKMFLKKL